MAVDPLQLVGQTLNDFELTAFIDQGGFGVVYEAEDLSTRELVAVKVLKPGANIQSQQEFTNEANLLVRLTNASRVVGIFDTGTASLNVTLVGGATMPMPFRFHVLELADRPLSKFLINLDEIDWSSRLSIYRDVVLGVHQMHAHDMAHRDVKADNILLFPKGNRVVAKVNDLGRSRDLSVAPSVGVQYDFGRGDPSFAAPEFLWGAGSDESSMHLAGDLYGLGSLFFELTFGQGLTGLALIPHSAMIVDHRSMMPDERRSTYRARLSEIRTWYDPSLELLGRELPGAIRQQGVQLVRQLCDPDPKLRLPRIAPGRRGSRPDHLCWLLNRIDSMRLSLRNADRQAAELLRRKTSAK